MALLLGWQQCNPKVITVVQQHLSTTERAKYGIVAGLATMQSQSHHGGAAASVLNEEKT
jgi:hypothetical protein